MSIINIGDTPINENQVDGTELARRLERLYLAFHSQNSNVTRPPYITAGGIWSKTINGGFELMLFDGAVDTKIGSVINGQAIVGAQGKAFADDFNQGVAYKKGDVIWNIALAQFEIANKDIAAGNAKNQSDWVITTNVFNDAINVEEAARIAADAALITRCESLEARLAAAEARLGTIDSQIANLAATKADLNANVRFNTVTAAGDITAFS